MSILRSTLIGSVLLAFTSPIAAQQIVGEVVDPAVGPVAGAFIRLLDADGRFVRGVLSDSAGRFVLRIAEPGRYRVRAERIGQVSVEEGPFDVAADAVVRIRLESGTRAIALDGLAVEGEKRCTTRPDRAAGAARVWDEARKALELTIWAKDNAELAYRSTVFARDLGPKLELRDEVLRSVANVGYKSFSTARPEELQEHGFARVLGDSIEYYGLDAEMLLSDWFLDTHCFELEAGADAHLIGLRFRPVRDRSRPEVEGTLWVDRSTGELRHISYGYLRMDLVLPPLMQVKQPSDPEIPEVRMTGRTSFRRLDSGIWIVDDWWIRVPVLTRMRGEVHLDGWRTRGGVVLDAWQRGDVSGRPWRATR